VKILLEVSQNLNLINDVGVALKHDKVSFNTSMENEQTIVKTRLTVMPHPSYIPDLAPSDF